MSPYIGAANKSVFGKNGNVCVNPHTHTRPAPLLSWILESCSTKMIALMFGSIHLDYPDRIALIMICGSCSSEVCQKTVNVKSPPVVSNYPHTHTLIQIRWASSSSRFWPMSLLLPPVSPRWETEWRAGSCGATAACSCVSGHLAARSGTQKHCGETGVLAHLLRSCQRCLGVYCLHLLSATRGICFSLDWRN